MKNFIRKKRYLLFVVILLIPFIWFVGCRFIWSHYYNKFFQAYENANSLQFIEDGYHCSYNTLKLSDSVKMQIKLPKDGYFNGEIIYENGEIIELHGKKYAIAVKYYPQPISHDRFFVCFKTSTYSLTTTGDNTSSEEIGIEIDSTGKLNDDDASYEAKELYSAGKEKINRCLNCLIMKNNEMIGE